MRNKILQYVCHLVVFASLGFAYVRLSLGANSLFYYFNPVKNTEPGKPLEGSSESQKQEGSPRLKDLGGYNHIV